MEIRVHGVSGTPPYTFLQCTPDQVELVHDEGGSQVYRRKGVGPAGDEDGRLLEAFHWSRFTSGSPRNALWILLLPFGIINAAQFMLYRPRAAGNLFGPALYALSSACLRFLGMILTLLFSYGVSVIAMDLVAWQVYDARADPSALVLSALAPVSVLAVLVLLGRKDITEKNTKAAPGSPSEEERAADDVPPSDFAEPGFYSGNIRSPHLWMLHVAGSLALIWWLLGGYTGLDSDLSESAVGSVPLPFALGPIGSIGPTLALALAAVLVVVLGDPENSAAVTKTSEPQTATRLWRLGLRLGAAGVLALSVLGLARAGFETAQATDSSASARTMPGMDRAALLLLVAGLVALIALVVFCGLLSLITRSEASRHQPAQFSRYAGGNAAPLAAALATWLAMGFTAGLIVLAGEIIDASTESLVEPPQIAERATHAWALTTGALVGASFLVMTYAMVKRSHYKKRARSMFGHASTQPARDGLDGRVATKMFIARLKNGIVPSIALISIVGLILAVAATLEMVRFTWAGGLPGELLDILDACDPDLPQCTPSDAMGWLSAAEMTPASVGTLALIGAFLALAVIVLLVATIDGVNLFRETDRFAGPVLSWERENEGVEGKSRRIDTWDESLKHADEVEGGLRKCGRDWRLLDPPADEIEHTKPKIRGHSDFFRDTAWDEAINQVRPRVGELMTVAESSAEAL